MSMPVDAAELLRQVLDPGTFIPWRFAQVTTDAPRDYQTALTTAQEATGTVESVVVGEGVVHGRRVALIVGEFGFLGGSLGVSAAIAVAETVTRATAEGLPVLAATASGGTRMQEGTAAFVHMISITAAITEHRRAGLPYLVYLRHPTTGGVFASWGSLGHLSVGEPGALLGFLGPRVYQAIMGETFPEGVQRAENLAARGIIDAVVPVPELRAGLDRTLRIMCDPTGTATSTLGPSHPGSTDAWASVQHSRHPDRPGIRDILTAWSGDIMALNGTGSGESDPGLYLALVRHREHSFVLLAQDRDRQSAHTALGPGALREARRGMRLATELRLPLVTVIDTPGAALSQAAEEGGLAGEIARCLADQLAVEAATVSIILGAGTGGGALALLPADITLVAEHGWLSPLPPEGASAIMYRNTDHAATMAAQQGINSATLLTAGIADHVIAEGTGAASARVEFMAALSDALIAALSAARQRPMRGRVRRRGVRYQRVLPSWPKTSAS